MVPAKELTTLLGDNPLTNYIAIGVPSTYKISTPHKAMQAVFVQIVEDRLCELFGGTSTTPVRGSYRAQSGEVVNEGLLFVGAYMSDADLRLYARDIIELAYMLKNLMQQESIAVIANGTMRFI